MRPGTVIVPIKIVLNVSLPYLNVMTFVGMQSQTYYPLANLKTKYRLTECRQTVMYNGHRESLWALRNVVLLLFSQVAILFSTPSTHDDSG